VLGVVYPGAHGLFSFLNMPTDSSIELSDGSMSPLHQVSRSAEKFGKLWMVKKEIAVVLVGNRAGLGPASTVRAGYTKPFPHTVRVLIGGYELYGQIQTGGRFDFSALMFEGSNTFVPLYDGRLASFLFPNARSEAPAMMFNREMVESLSLISSMGP
jgi:hypothetical protein